MTEKPLTVEFILPTRTSRRPKPLPEEKGALQRQDRAARRARNLALAYWIDGLIRSGQVESLAAVARMCGVSRARVSMLMEILALRARDRRALLARKIT